MIRYNNITDLYFFNSLFMHPDPISGKQDSRGKKSIFIPDIPDSIHYALHLCEKYSGTLNNSYLEGSLEWMIPRLKGFYPGIQFHPYNTTGKNPPLVRKNKIFLYPQSDTLASSIIPVYQQLASDMVKIITPRSASEGTEELLNSRNIPFTKFSCKLLAEEKPDVMVFLNDWTREVQRIIAHCRRSGIATVCLQESVIDFGDHFRRMQHTDYAFVQGSQTAYDLPRGSVFITGNPRYERIQKKVVSDQSKVIINCNFTYGIYEDQRYSWLDSITETLDTLKLDYEIIQHPRDTGDLKRYRKFTRTHSATVHDLLSQASIVITRFSSLIHEALLMGIPVIYFNPHNEKMKYGFDFNQSFIQLAGTKEELKSGIEEIISRPYDPDELNSYITKHCLPASKKPSVIIAELLLNYPFRPAQFGLTDSIKMILYHPFIRKLYKPFTSLLKTETT